jgi:hypothetical protein
MAVISALKVLQKLLKKHSSLSKWDDEKLDGLPKDDRYGVGSLKGGNVAFSRTRRSECRPSSPVYRVKSGFTDILDER